MKPILAKVSVALLSVVFILGCQDQGPGPVGPDGLVAQFDKAGSGECPEAASGGHCHGVQPTGDATWRVSVTINGSEEVVRETTLDGLVWVDFPLNLAFFNGELGCSMGDSGIQTGDLWIREGDDHVHVFFTQFTHSESGVESKHAIEMGGELVGGELPPVAGTDAEIRESPDGHWEITAKGRKRQNGCTGVGEELVLTVTVEALQ